MSAKKKAVVDTSISIVKRDSRIPAAEIATAQKDYLRYQSYIKMSRNPDPILNTTSDGMAKGIALFADMKKDCHVSYCLRRLKLTVTRNPFAVVPGGESQQDLDAAEFIRGQIKKHYYNLIAYILDALAVGFSVTEFWCEMKGDRAEIAALKKRRQERFAFDEFGNLLLRTEQNRNGEAIPQEGFIVATYQEEDNNYYGDGILSTCFWPWWFKKHGLLFWANGLERYNQPIAVGTFPSGTLDDKKDDFLEALESIQSDYAITIPEGWKVELQKGMDSGNFDSFENFQNFMDHAISKAINGAVINQGEQKYGSKGADEVIKDIGDEDIEAAAEYAVSKVNEILIPRLCDWNFTLDAYPEFLILYKNKKLTKEETEVIDLLANAGMPIPVAEISEAQGWKAPENEDLVLYKGKMIAYGDIAKENERIVPGETSALPAAFAEEVAGDTVAASDKTVIADGQLVDSVFDAAAGDLRAAYDEQQLLDLVVDAGDYVAASKALKKYKPKKIEEAWREILELGHWLGEYSVAQQAGAAQFAEPAVMVDDAWYKLKPKEAIAWLKNKIPVTKAVYDKLTGAAKNAAFYVAGLEDLELINAVRERMIRALEKGITFRQFARELKMAGGADPFFTNMKTAFYTNVHQAMVAQDYAALERVKDILPYRRYSAILDSATRPEHRKWHNFVALASDPIWNYLYSLLMDFNCRCRITAATEADYKRLAGSSAGIRGDDKYPEFEANPSLAATDKLKELLKVKSEYADFLDSKLGSWAKIMKKIMKNNG